MTGASASPKPKPPITGAGRDRLSSDVRPQGAIQRKPIAASSMPAAVTTPAGEPAGEVAADHGADRQRDQEAHQHQRRQQLRSAEDGRPGEERDVDQRRDQGRADEEADQDGPQAGVRRSAPRGTRGPSARRRCSTKATAASAAPSRNQSPWSEKTCTSGSAVAKARITPAERERQQHRADEVGVAHGADPVGDVEERAAGGAAAEHQQHERADRGHAERGSTSGRRRRPG